MNIKGELKKMRKALKTEAAHQEGGVLRYDISAVQRRVAQGETYEAARDAEIALARIEQGKNGSVLIVPRRNTLTEEARSEAANMLEPRD